MIYNLDLLGNVETFLYTRCFRVCDGSLPIEYQNVLDALDVLRYVAAITNKIALGTSVADMLFYTPFMQAKNFATLDVLSQGRAISGVGLGWSKDEYQAYNTPFTKRTKSGRIYSS